MFIRAFSLGIAAVLLSAPNALASIPGSYELTGFQVWTIALVIMFVMVFTGGVPLVAFIGYLVAYLFIQGSNVREEVLGPKNQQPVDQPWSFDFSWIIDSLEIIGAIVIFGAVVLVLFRILRYGRGLGPSSYSSSRYSNSSSCQPHSRSQVYSSTRPSMNSTQSQGPTSTIGQVKKTLYHGTPTIKNAQSIADGTGTWIVGNGNLYGTGVYLADRRTAQAYANSNGGIVKVKLSAPGAQIADYYQVSNSSGFQTWRRQNGSGNLGDEIARFVTEQLGKRFLQVNQNMFVVLVDPNLKSIPVSFQGLKVIEAYDLAGNKIA